MTNRLRDYLDHIVEACVRIETYTNDMTDAGFFASDLVQDAVIRNLEIIGEASRNILRTDPDIVVRHPDIPFSIAYEMRNALAHGYFKVDMHIVWQTVIGDLPRLKTQVTALRLQIEI